MTLSIAAARRISSRPPAATVNQVPSGAGARLQPELAWHDRVLAELPKLLADEPPPPGPTTSAEAHEN